MESKIQYQKEEERKKNMSNKKTAFTTGMHWHLSCSKWAMDHIGCFGDDKYSCQTVKQIHHQFDIIHTLDKIYITHFTFQDYVTTFHLFIADPALIIYNLSHTRILFSKVALSTCIFCYIICCMQGNTTTWAHIRNYKHLNHKHIETVNCFIIIYKEAMTRDIYI